MNLSKYIFLIGIQLLPLFYSKGFGQIALQFNNDASINTHSLVLFTEMFEQSSISNLISQSGYASPTMTNHILFDTSVPLGSLGSQSLKLRTVETSTSSSDPNEDSNLLIKFPGITDSIFVRYYVKYNTNFTFHHSGVWIGGTDPNNICWPCYKPGRPYPVNGDSAFVVGSEIRGAANISPQLNSKFGLYNYWRDMKIYTSGPNAGKYYGNEFISPNPLASINMSSWNCIEVMIKLNNSLNDSIGESKLWINGQLIAHYGYGFPNGTWSQAFFNEGVGNPFEGFRWRNNSSVALNYVWIKNYSTDNVSTANNDVLFDHLVVAKSYIGPINLSTSISEKNNTGFVLKSYPNPTTGDVRINFNNELEIGKVIIYDVVGKQVSEQNNTGKHRTINIKMPDPAGIYFIKIEALEGIQNIKIIKE